jgi:hypothetical protein
MRRWVGAVVALGALTLCAVAAGKTHYTSGTPGKAPFIGLTVSGGRVTKVNWVLLEDCGQTFNGPTHLNARIKRNGRFSGSVTYSIPGNLGGSSGGTHIWGRINAATATVTIDDYSSGQSQSICEGRHRFLAVRVVPGPPHPPAPTLAFDWLRPEPIQPHGTTALNWVACPSAKLCVAVDDRGAVLSTTAPTHYGRWIKRAQDIAPNGKRASLAAVACPSMSLCVAVDHNGGVLSSTHPTRTGSWRRAEIDPGNPVLGIACPSTHLCVAFDSVGFFTANVLASVDPAGGAHAWTLKPMPNESRPFAIACPSVRLCVMGAYDTDLFVSRNPRGGKRAWRNITPGIDSSFLRGSVACPSTSLCVANDLNGDLVTSTTPTVPRSRSWYWRGGLIARNAPNETATACPSTRLCVAIRSWPNPDGAGPADALVTRTPTKPMWKRNRVDSAQVNGISCPSTRLCVAVDARGRAILAIGR